MTMAFDGWENAPDEALLTAYANGDLAAASLLTRRLAPRAMAVATRMLKDRAEAEDVTQEAMLRLWTLAPDWRQGEAQVFTWVLRVVSNLCIDRLRKTKRSVSLDTVSEPPAEGPTVVMAMTVADRAKALDAALAGLPDRQRQAVVLRHLEGLTNPEIAGIMDIGVEAVESLTARGKRALKAALAGRRNELGYSDD